MGKPKITKKRIINALHDTKGTVYIAANRLQVAPSTVYRYIEKYPDVAEVKDYYDNELVDIAELRLRGAVNKEDMTAIKYVLSTKGRNRGWGEKHQMEHSGKDGDAIKVEVDYRSDIDEISVSTTD